LSWIWQSRLARFTASTHSAMCPDWDAQQCFRAQRCTIRGHNAPPSRLSAISNDPHLCPSSIRLSGMRSYQRY
jgi:hypothetical protein